MVKICNLWVSAYNSFMAVVFRVVVCLVLLFELCVCVVIVVVCRVVVFDMFSLVVVPSCFFFDVCC